MHLTSAIMIYVLFWWLCLFVVLPFRLQNRNAADQWVPGQAESAPPRFSVGRTIIWTSIVAAAAFSLYYVNYVEGWITADTLDISGLVPK